jgi:predicted nucleic acid-binding protein
VSGIKYLLDTNAVIGLLNDAPVAKSLRATIDLQPTSTAVSQITKIELLGYADITAAEESTLQLFLSKITVFPIDAAIEARTIALRKSKKIKLPDAIVAATAAVKGLQLVTFDKALLKTAEAETRAST